MMPPAHKPLQTVTFSGCIGSSSILLTDIHSIIDNSAYLRAHWVKNELRHKMEEARNELS